MPTILRIFFGEKAVHPWMVLGCLLVASLFEGVSVAALLPLLSLATDSAADSAAFVLVERLLATLGLSAGLGNLVGLVIAGIILKAAIAIGVMYYVATAVADVATSLRTRLVQALLDVRWGYFVTKPVGRIINTLSVDATRAAQAYLAAATFLAQALKMAVYLAVAFVVSWQLALAAVIVGGTIALALDSLVRMAKRAGRRQTERTSDLVTYLTDTLNSVKPLKAMARQTAFAALVQHKIGSLRKALRKQVISKELLRNLTEVLFALMLGAGFLAAVGLLQVEILELMVVGLILGRAVGTVRQMQGQLQRAAILESAHLATRALIEEAGAARETTAAGRTPTFERGLRLERVTFAHGPQVVLDDVSFALPAGSLTVLMGPSGVGKSTVADLILGLYEPQAGRILVDDVALSELDLRQWRASIGYVPQDLVLLHDTILTNVTLGDPRLGETEAREALELAGAWDFVSGLPDGLATGVGEKGVRFSGGQRQRIALARALVSKPGLLILDEVTSALDPRTEQELCARIAGLAGSMTIVAITHRPAFLDAADQLLRLEDGAVHRVPGHGRHVAAE